MDFGYTGQTARVTGASRGIGRATAQAFAMQGVRTGIVARRRELLEELSAEIIAAGGRAGVQAAHRRHYLRHFCLT